MELLKSAFRDAGIVVPLTFNDVGFKGNFNSGPGSTDLYGWDAYPQGFDWWVRSRVFTRLELALTFSDQFPPTVRTQKNGILFPRSVSFFPSFPQTESTKADRFTLFSSSSELAV